MSPRGTPGGVLQVGVRALKELARYTLAELRRLGLDLRPSVLDRPGLAAALVRYVRKFAQRTGIEADLSFHLRRPLPEESETAVYRVVQEALTNVARHSGSPRRWATNAWTPFWRWPGGSGT